MVAWTDGSSQVDSTSSMEFCFTFPSELYQVIQRTHRYMNYIAVDMLDYGSTGNILYRHYGFRHWFLLVNNKAQALLSIKFVKIVLLACTTYVLRVFWAAVFLKTPY